MNHAFNKISSQTALILFCGLLALAGCGKKSAAPLDQASMDELNRALAVVMMHDGQRLPSTNAVADFLKQTGKSFPAAPAGKKIILNPTSKKFEVVDQ
jgi:carbamate kinase